MRATSGNGAKVKEPSDLPRAARETGAARLRRHSLPREVADALRKRILDGEFLEDSVLRQDSLAAEYGVSRVPLREALRLLEGEGFITINANRGAVVTVPTETQIAELYDLRAMLEEDLVKRAIPNAGPEDFARAEAVLRKLDVAGELVSSWGPLNAEFHRALYLPSGRERTLALVQTIHLQTERFIRLQLTLTRDFEKSQDEHREILRLYRQRKAAQCGAYLKRHILDGEHALMDAVKKRGSTRG